MKTTHYLCNLLTKTAMMAGPLPDCWGAMASLPQEGDPDLLDLGWAGHPHMAFMNYQQALNVGIVKSTLDAMRVTVLEEVWRDIQSMRDDKYLGGVNVAGKWFHTDADSRSRYLDQKDKVRDMLADGASMPSPVLGADGKQTMWKTMDGSTIGMTCQLMYDVVVAARNQQDQVFSTSEAHRQGSAEAPDPVLYDFSRNWPPTFV